MGAHPWFYFVPYRANLQLAFEDLRNRELRAGRYNPVVRQPHFPVSEKREKKPTGTRHPSISAAREAAGTDGTRSILDMDGLGETRDYGVITALGAARLKEYFGTEQPTRAQVDQRVPFRGDVEPGHGIYLFVYEAGRPVEICFAGAAYA